MEVTVSQIFDIGPSFDFMIKNGKPFVIVFLTFTIMPYHNINYENKWIFKSSVAKMYKVYKNVLRIIYVKIYNNTIWSHV